MKTKTFIGGFHPHATEFSVLARTHGDQYRYQASFVHESHAQQFAKSITCYQTVVIPPVSHEG